VAAATSSGKTMTPPLPKLTGEKNAANVVTGKPLSHKVHLGLAIFFFSCFAIELTLLAVLVIFAPQYSHRVLSKVLGLIVFSCWMLTLGIASLRQWKLQKNAFSK
jgi:hypothetical protein